MRFHEAIDMILEGGKAYRKHTDYVIFFSEHGLLSTDYSPDNDEIDTAEEAVLDRGDFTEADWIVEKDGVVYEEWLPSYKMNKENIEDINMRRSKIGEKPVALIKGSKDWFKIFSEDVSCPCCHSKDLIKADLKDIHSDFYTCTKCQWQGIFVQPHTIIADEVDEEWLEKKMLCFLLRKRIASWEDGKLQLGVYKEKNGTCCRKECEFCFPQERPKPDHICDVGKMVREKVTVEELHLGLTSILDAAISAQAHEFPKVIRDHHHDVYAERRKHFFLKLEYLVSLQEKD